MSLPPQRRPRVNAASTLFALWGWGSGCGSWGDPPNPLVDILVERRINYVVGLCLRVRPPLVVGTREEGAPSSFGSSVRR